MRRDAALGFSGLAAAVALVVSLCARPLEARTLETIRADGTLKVGLTGDYAPFSLRRADGTLVGADVVMARSLAGALGVTLVLVPTSWKTLGADFQADRFDIAMGGVSVTEERAALGDFSLPVLHDGKRPIVRCADRDRYVSLATIDLPGVRVVVNPGGTNERFARANIERASLTLHADNRSIFQEIVDGRADLMITDGVEVDYQSRRHPGVLCPAAVADSFDRLDKAYWLTRDLALKRAVDDWLAPVLQAGTYQMSLAAASNDR
jgi:cyclohexadienyl dehydratase